MDKKGYIWKERLVLFHGGYVGVLCKSRELPLYGNLQRKFGSDGVEKFAILAVFKVAMGYVAG